MTIFLIIVGLVVAVMVAMTLAGALAEKTVDVLGAGLGRALSGPGPQGFVALGMSSARVLNGLQARAAWNPESGVLTTESGRSVQLRTGWISGVRGFECRWQSDYHDTTAVMEDVVTTIRAVDPAATITS